MTITISITARNIISKLSTMQFSEEYYGSDEHDTHEEYYEGYDEGYEFDDIESTDEYITINSAS